MNARLTKVNEAVLEIAEGERDYSKSDTENDYAAICAIKDAYKCNMDQAASLLVNARFAEKALQEMIG